jgi:hypothetical protein
LVFLGYVEKVGHLVLIQQVLMQQVGQRGYEVGGKGDLVVLHLLQFPVIRIASMCYIVHGNYDMRPRKTDLYRSSNMGKQFINQMPTASAKLLLVSIARETYREGGNIQGGTVPYLLYV